MKSGSGNTYQNKIAREFSKAHSRLNPYQNGEKIQRRCGTKTIPGQTQGAK